MAIESTVDYIDDLNQNYPGEDEVGTLHEGNDHLRNIKKAIKQTFPNITGAVLPTHTELNYVDGVTSGIQAQLNALSAAIAAISLIPTGTAMLFAQASAPVGWTKVTTHNDKALRVVSGTGGGSGGSVAFSTVFGRTASDGTVLSVAQIPAHTHYVFLTSYGESVAHQHWTAINTTGGTSLDGTESIARVGDLSGSEYSLMGATGTPTIGLTGSQTATHVHNTEGNTAAAGGTQTHTHGVEMRVQYVDVIICTKD